MQLTSRNTVISIFTTIRVCHSRAHHITILTGHWTMSITLSNLVRNTSIWASLFSSFRIPWSWALHFLFPVTVDWTKFWRNNPICKTLRRITSIRCRICITYCYDNNNLALYIQQYPIFLDTRFLFHHN